MIGFSKLLEDECEHKSQGSQSLTEDTDAGAQENTEPRIKRKTENLVAPGAPRHANRRRNQPTGGFSSFLSSENSGDAEEVEKGDSKNPSTIVDTSAKPSEAHPSKLLGLSEDGATTRRAAKSSRVGGFTERLMQLNIQQSFPPSEQIADDQSIHDDEELSAADLSHLALKIQRPAKSLPDKSIMKKSRFGPPIIRATGEEVLPLASFWDEPDKFAPARRWQESVALTAAGPRASPIRRVHFQAGAIESLQDCPTREKD